MGTTCKLALGMGHLSPCEMCLGILDRVPLLGAMMFMKWRLWGQASLYGAQLGILECVHLPGTSRYG
jgi:disulfide bond formation protein DsbB